MSEATQQQFERVPVISLWQPWASWVMLGWKEIETRLHRRFYSLEGKKVGIHAACKWDATALDSARPYLQPSQIERTERMLRVGGAIIGTVCVTTARRLTADDSHRALIDCGAVERHGLVLAYPEVIEAIPCKGKQGIWYYEIPAQRNDA